MFVEQTRPGELDVHQSYKSGQLLLETAKMDSLNEFNLKKMWSEEEKDNAPSTRSDLPLDHKKVMPFVIKKTKRFNYSIRMNDFMDVERNPFAEEEMNRIQSEQINNISSSMYRLLCARMTEKKTPGNQKEIPENQKENPENQKETPENQEDISVDQEDTPGDQKENPENQNETPGNQQNNPVKKTESDFVFLKPKVYKCYYCCKLFFHPTIYRRHMIHELNKLHWCSICKRGFVSKLWLKRHKSFYCKKQIMCKAVR